MFRSSGQKWRGQLDRARRSESCGHSRYFPVDREQRTDNLKLGEDVPNVKMQAQIPVKAEPSKFSKVAVKAAEANGTETKAKAPKSDSRLVGPKKLGTGANFRAEINPVADISIDREA